MNKLMLICAVANSVFLIVNLIKFHKSRRTFTLILAVCCLILAIICFLRM